MFASIELRALSSLAPFWISYSDPLVCATIALSDGLEIRDGLTIISLISPPEKEERLLLQLISLFDGIDAKRLWFGGYGAKAFGVPYLLRRASRYGLQERLWSSIAREHNYDVRDMAKMVLRVPPERGLSLRECCRWLGLEGPRFMGRGSFPSSYSDWLRRGSLEALWECQEGAVMTLKILLKLSKALPSYLQEDMEVSGEDGA